MPGRRFSRNTRVPRTHPMPEAESPEAAHEPVSRERRGGPAFEAGRYAPVVADRQR